uniref:NADH-ubiquinone oxidoreductase chain 6 n=1 Tax=Percursaria percursa TaxID=153906 RepID=A0A8K1JAH3_9CHLO|nr:NADH dehydrogenase subunit 6 [Percursaria percursa]
MTILIDTFCALLITCATLVVQSSNPVYSVLFLILAFFNASALVLLSGHDYMAALFIVLYVGAMCTFFLFAIMILDIKVEPISEKRLKQAPINTIIAIIFALQCKNILNDFSSGFANVGLLSSSSLKEQKNFIDYLNYDLHYGLFSSVLDYTTQIYSLGSILYTTYAFELIIASLILLSAMLGSIASTLSRNSNAKGQHIYEQNIRDFKLTITNSN